jgi:sarcosine oxidase, subunit gamma
MTDPRAHLRRSFVLSRLQGAVLEERAGAAVAARFDEGDEAAACSMGLVDLSPLPRAGFKGAGTIPWLQARGLTLEPAPNRSFPQRDGTRALVLAPGEVLLLGDLSGDEGPIAALEAAWSEESGCWPVPRRDSHCWLAVTGISAPSMLAKLCAVDLRPGHFPDDGIAQTSVARSNAIVAPATTGGTPVFHLLADSASAGYLYDCLLDAMAELGGRRVGLHALLDLDRG